MLLKRGKKFIKRIQIYFCLGLIFPFLAYAEKKANTYNDAGHLIYPRATTPASQPSVLDLEKNKAEIDAAIAEDVNFSNAFSIDDITLDEQDNLYVVTSKGLYKTMDGGKIWKFLKTVYSTDTISYKKGLLILTDHAKGVYVSKDYGSTWVKQSSFQGIDKIIFGENDTIYADKNSNIYESSDAGKTWIILKTPQKFHSSIYFNNNLYGLVPDIKHGDKLYKLLKRNKKWMYLKAGKKFEFARLIGARSYLYLVEDLKNQIYYSKDGKTWQDLYIVKGKSIVADNQLFFAGEVNDIPYISEHQGGLFKIEEGNKIIEREDSLIPQSLWAGEIRKLIIDSKGTMYGFSQERGAWGSAPPGKVYKGTHYGKDWTIISEALIQRKK